MQKYLAANEDLNSMNKSQVMILENSLSRKKNQITFRTTLEREDNIRYTKEKYEVNQIPNKNTSDQEIKCVDVCTIDAKNHAY